MIGSKAFMHRVLNICTSADECSMDDASDKIYIAFHNRSRTRQVHNERTKRAKEAPYGNRMCLGKHKSI